MTEKGQELYVLETNNIKRAITPSSLSKAFIQSYKIYALKTLLLTIPDESNGMKA